MDEDIQPLAAVSVYASKWIVGQTVSRVTFQIVVPAADVQKGKWYVEESNDPIIIPENLANQIHSLQSKARYIDISNSPRIRIEGANGLSIQQTGGDVNFEVIITNPARFVRLRFAANGTLLDSWQRAAEGDPPLALWVTSGR